MKIVLLILSFIFIIRPLFSQNKQYTNPVGDSIFIADPFVLKFEETYFLYGTSAGDGFKYWTSDNLVNWKSEGYAYQKDENSWGKNSFWAPEVIHYKNKFYLIYNCSGQTMFGNGLRLCLAVSESPAGPFKDLYAPLFDFGFSCIDGHIFIDDDQKPYLFYEKVGAVGEFWNNNGYLWGAIFGTELSSDLSKPLREPVLCVYPSQKWEGLTSMSARSTEGMTVFKNNNTYYMTYSGNKYTDPNYGVGYATASKPLSMWTKYPGNPILKNDISNLVSGPGHNCIVKSPDNTEWFIVYHSHADVSNPGGKRILNIDRINFLPDCSIKVNGPTRTPQPYPSQAK
jgi:beta-xylosidase